MNDVRKTKSQLIEELVALRQYVAKLKRRRAVSREDRLKLAILDSAPVSMWACTKNFEIVLWACDCEKIYGHRMEDAVGKNYLELFVDEPEREQSKIDCTRIIDEDYVQKNFLAYDKAQNRQRRTMLTNCFRVWDEDNGEHLQAEMALEIGDLQLREDEHRTLREVGIARLTERARTTKLQRRISRDKLQNACSKKSGVYDQRLRDLNTWKASVVRKAGVAQAEEVTRKPLEKLRKDIRELEYRNVKLLSRILSANSLEDLDMIDKEVENFAKEDIKEGL